MAHRVRVLAFLVLACGLIPCIPGGTAPALAQEFWCEGVDDDGDGETDEGCDRTCVAPYALAAPSVIATNAMATSSVSLVRPGTGLAFAYADSRTGVSQVYVQVTATSGAPDKAEVRISDGVHPAYSPSLAWKGSGYGLAWVDEREGNPEVYFRELTAAGAPTGTDVAVSSSNGPSLNPVIAWNGNGFAVAWDDVKGSNRDIYFRRLDASGSPLGQEVRVTSHSALQEQASLAWDGTQYALAWTDERDGNREIYARRLDAAGGALGGEVRITSASGASERASLKALKSGDFAVAWQDARSGLEAIWYGRWIGPGYAAPAGVAVSAGTAASRKPSLATTGAEMLVAWEDLRDGSGEVYVQRLSADGAALSPEVRLTTGAGASGPSAAWHGSGLAVAYPATAGGGTARPSVVLAGCGGPDTDQDGYSFASGECNDVSAEQHPAGSEVCDALDNDCNGVADETCRGTCRANLPTGPHEVFASTEGGSLVVVATDGVAYGVVWQEREIIPGCCLSWALYFRRMDSGGNPLGDVVRLTATDLEAENATMAWTGKEYGIVFQQSNRVDFIEKIAFVRVDGSGQPVGPVREVTQNPAAAPGHTHPVLTWNGREYGIVFNDWEANGTVRAVQLLRLNDQGRPVERPRDVAPPPFSELGYVAADPGGFAVAYLYRVDPYFQKLDAFGGFIGSAVALEVDDFDQGWPRVVATPWGYGVHWREDSGFPGQVGEVFYQKLDLSGVPLGPLVNLHPQPGALNDNGRLTWIGNEFLFAYEMQSPDRIVLGRRDENGAVIGADLQIDNDPNGLGAPRERPEMAWNGVGPALVWSDSRWGGGGHPHPALSFQTCCEDVSPPGLVSGLVWPSPAIMSWTPSGSERYDRVRGDLQLLQLNGGDFSTTVLDCKNDLTQAQSDETDIPGGAGFYYLVRGDSVCWAGSYDGGATSQQGSRDSEVNSSGNACP